MELVMRSSFALVLLGESGAREAPAPIPLSQVDIGVGVNGCLLAMV